MMEQYADILHLAHPVSSKHPRMTLRDRAAQFSPFAALTGYEDAIAETGRLTRPQIHPEEDAAELLDRKLRQLHKQLHLHPEIRMTVFVPDAHKEGGSYQQITGNLKRIDCCGKQLLMTDGRSIPMASILSLESSALTEK